MSSTKTGNYKSTHLRGPQKGLPRTDLKYVNRTYLYEVFGKLSPFFWVACKEGSLAGMYLYPDLRASFQKEYFGNRGHRSTGAVRSSTKADDKSSPSTTNSVRPVGGRQNPKASPPLVKRGRVVADDYSGPSSSSPLVKADEKKKSTKDAVNSSSKRKTDNSDDERNAHPREGDGNLPKSTTAAVAFKESKLVASDIMAELEPAIKKIEESIEAQGKRIERLEKSFKDLTKQLEDGFNRLLSILVTLPRFENMSGGETSAMPASANTKASAIPYRDAWCQTSVPPAMPFNERYMAGGTGLNYRVGRTDPPARDEPRTAPTPRTSTSYRPYVSDESSSSSEEEYIDKYGNTKKGRKPQKRGPQFGYTYK